MKLVKLAGYHGNDVFINPESVVAVCKIATAIESTPYKNHSEVHTVGQIEDDGACWIVQGTPEEVAKKLMEGSSNG